ncbi:aminoglycoside phosphotransferase family protein [Lampropedia aestuarii]|uniref:aminoglycoside phosphotransferase family protein n=1 Tax=Lampropedia aestuarii TaxID=2562762 RepID=UPI002469B885|nr:phosphotransferase [Lampropedia aestuarii]MDH5855842.1 phosphotransferase [Lampropedia aestuarii]
MTTIQWAEPARQVLFEQWLTAIAGDQQLATSSLQLASSDASFRRYFRIQTTTGQSRIIMDAPPEKEPLGPFMHVAQLLHEAGIPTPRLLQSDVDNGFLLMDDLGQQTVLQYLAPEYNTKEAYPLMLQSVDWLVQMQMRTRADVPAYDHAVLMREMQLFPEWYLGRYRQATLSDSQQQTLHKTFELIAANNLAAPQVFVHRDYMLRNLMVTPADAAGAAQISGVLDFQDALHGPITYDLASLLRDAFHSWEEDFLLDIAVRYWEKARKAGLLASAPELEADFGEFYRAVEWMGLQRHLKVAGIFARLTLRDGKAKYLEDTPRFLHYIRSTASRYRELFPMLRLIDALENTQKTEAFSFGRL